MKVNGRTISIGAGFETAEEAALAHDAVALYAIGPDALRNFPEREIEPQPLDHFLKWKVRRIA